MLKVNVKTATEEGLSVNTQERTTEKQYRSPEYYRDRKHVSFITTTEDYVMLQYLKRRMSKSRRERVSMSEVIRTACKMLAGEPDFLTDSPPIRVGNKF